MRWFAITFLTVVVVSWVATGADRGSNPDASGLETSWPWFLGPDRNSVSKETNLARSWPEGGPKELWSVDVGPGFAGASIRDGEVYLLDRVADEKDVLRVFSLDTGKELWKYAYDAPGEVDHPGSRSMPTVDEKYIFTVGSFGHFHAFDRKTHKVLWKRHLLDDFSGRLPTWAVAQSPLLYKDKVIVAPQAGETCVVAYDKATGNIAWKSPYVGSLRNYTSPTLEKVAGADHIIQVTGAASRRRRAGCAVAGFDPETGKLLWKYEGWQCSIPVPNVTAVGEDRFFVTGGYGSGCAMFKVERSGEEFKTTEIFANDNCGAQLHVAALHEGHLYANSNDNTRRDGLLCLDLQGNVKWKTGRSPNFERGGLLLADGLLFIMEGDNGTLRLVEPNPEGYKELARARIFNGKVIWGPLALSGGKLVLRSQEQLKCLDVAATK